MSSDGQQKVSSLAQFPLSQLLRDRAFLQRYLRESRRRLRARYCQLTAALTSLAIPFVPAQGGIFLLVDLSRHLIDPSFQAEDALFEVTTLTPPPSSPLLSI